MVKKILALAVVLSTFFFFTPPFAYASNSIGQTGGQSATASCTTASSCSQTYTVTAGNPVVLFFAENSTGVSMTATCGGKTMTSIGSITPFLTYNLQVFYATGVSSGSQTCTATVSSGTATMDVQVISYTGVDQTTPVDQGNCVNGSGSTTFTYTTAHANEWIVGNVNALAVVTAGTGIVNYYANGGGPGFGDSGNLAVATSHSITFTHTLNGGGCALALNPLGTTVVSTFNFSQFFDF